MSVLLFFYLFSTLLLFIYLIKNDYELHNKIYFNKHLIKYIFDTFLISLLFGFVFCFCLIIDQITLLIEKNNRKND